MSRLKRFWKTVSTEERDGLFRVVLDGRPVRLPQGAELALSSRPLARAVAAEWETMPEGAEFSPDSLSLTRMSGTMIERIAPDRAAACSALLRFAEDDELCYRVRTSEESVAARVFAWLAEEGIRPQLAEGVMPIVQPETYRQKLQDLLVRKEARELCALGVLTQALNSLLLSLALIEGKVDVDEALAVADEDERRQLAVWGPDRELRQRLERRAEDVRQAMRFLTLAAEGSERED